MSENAAIRLEVRTLIGGVLVLSAIGLSGPLLAAPAAGGANPTATIVPAQPKVVCWKEKVIGSHIKRRVCRTEEQIAQDPANARAQLKAMQDYQAQTWQRGELELRH